MSDGNFERPNINSKGWKNTIRKHVIRGGSAQVAKLFDIEYDKLSCFLRFEDIRSDKHIVVTIKGISAEEIAEKLRTVFSVTRKSGSSKQNPLDTLERSRNNEKLRIAGHP